MLCPLKWVSFLALAFFVVPCLCFDRKHTISLHSRYIRYSTESHHNQLFLLNIVEGHRDLPEANLNTKVAPKKTKRTRVVFDPETELTDQELKVGRYLTLSESGLTVAKGRAR
jgi:hypothetical protein